MTPSRPAHPCARPGCPKLVTGASYCPEHEQTRRQKSPEQKRFYSSRSWRRTSELIRKQRPVCESCRAKPSKVVDHVNGDWQDNRPENLQALCTDCNATKTARQHRAKAR